MNIKNKFNNGELKKCNCKSNLENNQNIEEKKEFPVSQTAKEEQEILEFWNKNKIFEESIKSRENNKEFIFYDGPPFATGMPHYGHILAGTIKDIIPRYKTMCGFKVTRNWGWDCHGLPIENMIEKELNFNSKADIENYGIDKFNQKAKESVLRYDKEWKDIIPRTGRWVNMDNPYKTMDSNYTESLWWAFSELNKKNLIKRDFKSMHICPRCETTLSNTEVALNYKNIKDLSLIAKFQLKDERNVFILAWTTTPWTLPGNVALAINKNIDYVRVINSENSEVYIFAEKLMESLQEKINFKLQIQEKFKGSELINKRYFPLFDYYSKNENIKNIKNGWKIYSADFVNIESGTGVVHIAPAFGEDDMKLFQEKSLPFIQHVGMDGKFKKEVIDFAGLKVRKKEFNEEADVEIIKFLAKSEKLFFKEKYEHSYPYCWRCDTPLLNYATDSWFINSPQIRDKLLSENEKINWIPEHIGKRRFHNWLENIQPWAVSRSRYWGAPIPVWENKETKEFIVMGSLKELKKHTKTNDFFIVRHGQSEANVSDIISCLSGEFGDKLTQVGKKQCQETGKKIIELNQKIDIFISSPFKRTRETAEIIAETINFPKDKIIYDDRIKEKDFGNVNGELSEKYNSLLNLEDKDFSFYNKFNNGESHLDVKKRVMDFIYEINEKYKNKKILIISHQDPIRFLQIGSKGLENEEALSFFKQNSYKNAHIEKLDFAPIPQNEEYILDFHRPYIDKISFINKKKQKYEFIKEVFDCWFESGSMPFASKHYPFKENSNFNPEKNIGFPANFISEGQDQTRGWFNTLIILSIALFDKAAYKNVIVSGMILAEDGKKMSKSLKNYPDINYTLNKYGADAIRLYMLSSPVVRSETLLFAEKGIDEILKKVIHKSKNVLVFYNLYKNELKEEKKVKKSPHILDKWILERTKKLLIIVTENLEKYELDLATKPFISFVDDLSTWYIRRSRDRFKGTNQEDKDFAISTTKEVLRVFTRCIAPFAPFIADILWKEVRNEDEPKSVHLTNWPEVKENFLEKVFQKEDILELMDKAREIVSRGLENRLVSGLKVRQPLESVLIIDKDFLTKKVLKENNLINIIKDELNLKNVYFESDIKKALNNEKYQEKYEDIKLISQEEKNLIVLINKNLDEELIKEGNFREFLRLVQNIRKQSGLNVKEKIELKIQIIEGDCSFLENYTENLKNIAGVEKIYYSDLDDSIEIIKINNLKIKILLIQI